MQKLRLREVKELPRGDTAGKLQSWDLNPALFDTRICTVNRLVFCALNHAEMTVLFHPSVGGL